MKTKRYKRAQKILTFFKYHYKITAPFKVLVDGTFCMAALANKLNLKEQLPKYLSGETEICTTRCVMKELEDIGPDVYGALAICRNFEVIHCPHTPSKGASDCFLRFAKKMRANNSKFVIATQDDVLTEKLRLIPGVPVLYIKYRTILIDKPSDISLNDAQNLNSEFEKINTLKKSILGDDDKVIRKKKKIKGANPLSCKKKKVKVAEQKTSESSTKTVNGKRKRKKKISSGISTTSVST